MFFDADQAQQELPEQDDFTPLPPGWYHAAIIGSEAVMPNNPQSNAGEMVKLTIEINGDEHPSFAKRQVFSYLCINHTNDKPRNIARRNLATICHAANTPQLQSPEELLGAAIMVRLKLKPAKGEHPAGNDIDKWAAPGSEKTAEAPKLPASGTVGKDTAKPGGWKR